MARTELTSTTAKASAFDANDERLLDGDYQAYVVAVQSYRSLRRYITRHVVPHADSRIRRLIALDSGARAKILYDDPRALEAWAVAIWSSDLERKAFSRLWTDMSKPAMRDRIPTVLLDRDAMGMALTVKAPEGPLRAAQSDWLLRHATLATLRHRFARARALARGLSKAGDAELGKEMLGRNRLGLTGEVLDGGDLQFTVEAEPMRDTLVPLPSQTKAQRRTAAADMDRQRLHKLKQLCIGPCLRFTWRDGWGVASSTVPDIAAGITVKRSRLFAEGRPGFILFSTPTGWCARMVDVPLEVHDDEPWKVIDTLRHAYTRYKKQQETRSAKPTKEAVEVLPAETEPPRNGTVTPVATREPALEGKFAGPTANATIVNAARMPWKVTSYGQPELAHGAQVVSAKSIATSTKIPRVESRHLPNS